MASSDDLRISLFPNIGYEKLMDCLTILEADPRGPLTKEQKLATLFLAESRHAQEYGRPIYGDTWIRTPRHRSIAAMGAAALMMTRPKAPRIPEDRACHVTSQSDREALATTLAAVLASPNPADLVKADPLYGDGKANLPVDYLDLLPPEQRADEDIVSDYVFQMTHAAF